MNKYITKQIVESVGKNDFKNYDKDWVITYSLKPSEIGKSRKELYKRNYKEMKGTYNTYTTPQVLYLTSPYLNGNRIKSPGEYYTPTNPEHYSPFSKNSYSSYDYFKIDSIIKPYTDENGKHWTKSNMTVQKSVIMNYYTILQEKLKIIQTIHIWTLQANIVLTESMNQY